MENAIAMICHNLIIFILEIIDVYFQTSILLALLVKFKLINCTFGQKSTPRKEKLV